MIRVFSFGAGVQSVAIVRLSFAGLLPPLNHLIFADTGDELPGTYRAAVGIKDECDQRGIGFHVVRNHYKGSSGHLWLDTLTPNKRGCSAAMPFFTLEQDQATGKAKKGFTRRQCTGDYKIEPIRRKLRELAGVGRRRKFPDGPVIEQWLGISTDESQRQKVADRPWFTIWHPLIQGPRPMSRDDCAAWLIDNAHEVPPKSACFYCPYQSLRRWQELRLDHPDLWAKAVALDDHVRANRKQMGLRAMPFLSARRVPLAELPSLEPANDDDGFGDECAGVCGV